jgi:hypothetical protein
VTRSELRPERTDLSALGRSIAGQLTIAEPERTVKIVVQDGLRAFVDPALLGAH